MKNTTNQLTTKQFNEFWNDLMIILTDTKKQKEMSDFLDSFLTKAEKLILIKRIGILKLLYSDFSYEQIQSELQVSSATISSVAKIKDKAATNSAIEKLAIHAWADQLSQKVLSWFNR